MFAHRVSSLRDSFLLIEKSYDVSGEIQNDPVSWVLQYREKADREVAALIASAFAYGRVKQIQTTLSRIGLLLGPRPSTLLREQKGAYWQKVVPKNFKHRFNNAQDLAIFLTWIGEALRESGTLESFFVQEREIAATADLTVLLESFVNRLTSLPCSPFQRPSSKGALFFLPRPSQKSACKRLLLFLRWVAGSGPMDLHLWTQLPRSILLIPVDTHVLRISRHLGLTRRRDNSWKTAQEITSKLRLLDAGDPTRFDFALCHLGISQECPSRYQPKICAYCRMNTLCVTYNRRKKRLTVNERVARPKTSSSSDYLVSDQK